jgi:hypothetical protein
MSTQQHPDTTDDWIALLMLLTGVTGMGLFSVGAFVAPVRDALVQWGLLTQGDSVLIPLMDGGVGFDIWRVLIIAGVIVLFVAGSISLARKRRRREGR